MKAPFDLATDTGAAEHYPRRILQYPWPRLSEDLDAYDATILPSLLSADERHILRHRGRGRELMVCAPAASDTPHPVAIDRPPMRSAATPRLADNAPESGDGHEPAAETPGSPACNRRSPLAMLASMSLSLSPEMNRCTRASRSARMIGLNTW